MSGLTGLLHVCLVRLTDLSLVILSSLPCILSMWRREQATHRLQRR